MCSWGKKGASASQEHLCWAAIRETCYINSHYLGVSVFTIASDNLIRTVYHYKGT